MERARSGDITSQLTIGFWDPVDRSTKRKTIYPIEEQDAVGYRPIGRGTAQSAVEVVNVAFSRVPYFFDRVAAYRLNYDRIDDTFEAELGPSNVCIEFLERVQ